MVLKSAPSNRDKLQLSHGDLTALATITVHHQHLQRMPKELDVVSVEQKGTFP